MSTNLTRMTEELQYLKNWRSNVIFSNSHPIKRAQRILNHSKKKTHRLCAKYNKVLYACRECKGSGLKHHLEEGFVRFSACRNCDSFGALTWIDKLTGGWKRCIL